MNNDRTNIVGQPTGGGSAAVADRAPDVAPPLAPAYSPSWKRAVAWAIDGAVGCSIMVALLGVMYFTGVKTDLPEGDVTGSDAVAVALSFLLFVAPMAYIVLMDGSKRGATLGKMAVGIRVCDATTFGRIGFARAFARRLVTTLLWSFFVIPGVLDALATSWDPRRQTWHDKVVGSVVIDRVKGDVKAPAHYTHDGRSDGRSRQSSVEA